MKIIEKLSQKSSDLYHAPCVTLAFLGDSVTQGCFEIYTKSDGNIETVFDQKNAYHAQLAQLLSILYPASPVSVINAGISGDNAPHGLERLHRDVISHSPDLAVVCFGLNDCGGGMEGLERYVQAMRGILENLQQAGIETILLTPNMMCTRVSCHLKEQNHIDCAASCMRRQNEGILDAYVDAARNLAREKKIPVCDCYAKWKTLAASGVDTTELLSNKINHPTREMNQLFAVSLLETMFSC